jgi:hypothetical protein
MFSCTLKKILKWSYESEKCVKGDSILCPSWSIPNRRGLCNGKYLPSLRRGKYQLMSFGEKNIKREEKKGKTLKKNAERGKKREREVKVENKWKKGKNEGITA